MHDTQRRYRASDKGKATLAAWRKRQPEDWHRERRAIANARRIERRAMLDGLKLRSGCVDCGYSEHAVALDFDHRPGEIKLFSIGIKWEGALVPLLAEIAKCDIRCANCHRVRTAERRQHHVA